MIAFRARNGILPNGFVFPPEAKDNETQLTFTGNVPVKMCHACNKHVATGVVYRKFASNLGTNDSKLNINSQLISFKVDQDADHTSFSNKTRVQITLFHLEQLKFGDKSRCNFYDKENLTWKDYECTMIEYLSDRTKTVCQCKHLTNFAVLMDISSREKDHDLVKNTLTIICSGLSILCLFATLLVFVFMKELHTKRTIASANLSFCLLVVNLCVVFGFDSTDNIIICRVISGVTLYALLSAFFWMLIQGYLLYQMVILVFASVHLPSTRTLFLFGYLPGFLLVGSFALMNGWPGFFEPRYNYFCWIASHHCPSKIWIFTGPAITIIITNFLILCMAVKTIVFMRRKLGRVSNGNIRRKSSDSSSTSKKVTSCKRLLTGWTSLFVLVGLTWFIGLLYIHEAISWFSYVFIALNGLQGAFIFAFEVVASSIARKTVVRIISRKSSLLKESWTNLTNSVSERTSSSCFISPSLNID
jgi:hypothetical protein